VDDLRTIRIGGFPIDVVLTYCVVVMAWCAVLFGLYCANGRPFAALIFAACFPVSAILVGVSWGRISLDRYAREISRMELES
jgi:hypothetical protein